MAKKEDVAEATTVLEDAEIQNQENQDEFNPDTFIEDLDKDEQSNDSGFVQQQNQPQLHPLEELAQKDILTDTFLKWRLQNPEGDFEDYVTEIGYKSKSSIEDLIEEDLTSKGKRYGWTKSEIEEAIEERKFEYSEMQGIKKKAFEADMLEKQKPKSEVLSIYKQKLDSVQKQRQAEMSERQRIDEEAMKALDVKVKSLIGTKYKKLVDVPEVDQKDLTDLAIRYSSANTKFDAKGRVIGYDIDSMVQDAMRKKYSNQLLKELAKKSIVEGKIEATKAQVRPSAGTGAGTQFVGGKSKQEAMQEIGKKKIW